MWDDWQICQTIQTIWRLPHQRRTALCHAIALQAFCHQGRLQRHAFGSLSVPKGDCVATQGTLCFQCFLADWADQSLALCTTVHGLCGIMHQLIVPFNVRGKGQGRVAWDMGHQGWEGGGTGPVPQGFVPKIISGRPFPM